MKNWKIWTAFLSVFVAGVIIGAVSLGAVLRPHFAPPKDHAEFREKVRERIMDRIRDKVRPDAAALPAIEAEIDLTIKQLDAIRKEVHPRLEETFKRAHERVRQYLNEEQRARFDAMLEERRKGKFGLFRPPPPPPPPF